MATDELVWEIRPSFTAYVLGVGGTVTLDGVPLGDAAARAGFRFAAVGTERTPSGRVDRFGGAVAFRAHAGMLDLELRDPWLIHDGPVTSISVVVRSRSMRERAVIAVDEGEGFGLTEKGADAFDDQYPVGASISAPRTAEG